MLYIWEHASDTGKSDFKVFCLIDFSLKKFSENSGELFVCHGWRGVSADNN